MGLEADERIVGAARLAEKEEPLEETNGHGQTTTDF
jgi:hypothetical protein